MLKHMQARRNKCFISSMLFENSLKAKRINTVNSTLFHYLTSDIEQMGLNRTLIFFKTTQNTNLAYHF